MKIILAPDKFKNSLTGLEFCDAVEEGIKRVYSNSQIVKLPLADGGDGTMEIIGHYLQAKEIKLIVNNPFFNPVTASYLYSESSKSAFIEMAEASGMKLLKDQELDCKNTTTLGTGEMIADAISRGATKIIFGIGGSATNDCGIGMATALGYRFLDNKNNEVKPIGANLSSITSIDDSEVHPKLSEIDFQVACDVSNPLYGEHGAAYVYAPQKGASTEDVKLLDKGLKDFSKILDKQFKIDSQTVKGAGAAGGMGIAASVFLKGNLEPGIELIMKLANFERQIENADWIITGEGKFDAQTLSGKTVQGVLKSASKQKIPVAVLCGQIEMSEESLSELGVSYASDILSMSKNLEDALNNSYQHLSKIAEIFINTLRR